MLGRPELDGVDGELVEFEWTNFPGHTKLEFLREIHKTMTEKRISDMNTSEIESSSCGCTTTPIGRKMETNKCVVLNSEVEAYAKRCCKGHWSFLGPGTEEKLYTGRTPTSQKVCLCGYDGASSPRKWTSYFSGNKCAGPEDLSKARKE